MRARPIRFIHAASAIAITWSILTPAAAQTPSARIDDALQNITVLVRAGKIGYATIWDGNKYIQCRRQPDNAMRCEAAGFSMQPSLQSVLTGERLNRLASLGWVIDPSFGNFVQTFPASLPTAKIAERIVQALSEGYAANIADLEIATAWIANMPCPPRNGPSQNLAGSVNDAPSMKATAVRSCSYVANTDTPQKAASAAELISIYAPTVTAEIQRLRINYTRNVFTVFDAGIGYIQCMPETPNPVLYCEAQSAESWPALSAILTPERVSLLQKAGYSEPGRAPNFWKSYPFEKYNDAAIANEILTLLYEVYGYAGTTKLDMKIR